MAGARKNRGFTLVELLVVITIIGMLVALLLPAIQSAREAGRRNTCQNNMRNCVLAMQNYESTRKSFPGYANSVAGKRASWVVPLLPYLERNDLFGLWQNNPGVAFSASTSSTDGPQLLDSTGAVLGQNPWAFSELNILECPSNPNVDTTRNPNSFVVNCGSAKTAMDNLPTAAGGTSNVWPEDPNSGVCFNQYNADAGSSAQSYVKGGTGTGPKTSMDFISTGDGTSYTMLMSENLQASTWASDPTVATGALQLPWQSDFQLKQNMGFVWFLTGNVNNAGPTPVQSEGINSQGQTGPTPLQPVAYDSTDPFTKPGMVYSRPSSSHPTGVLTAFCDGHVRFLSEEIQYHVFTQLMTPRHNKVVIARDSMAPYAAQKTVANSSPKWTYIISETDYE